MSKLPAFQFYPKDYLEDPNLKLCSLAAQGLWMRLLCHMFLSEERGYLRVKGRVIPPDKLPSLVGYPDDEIRPLIKELEEWNVFSRDEDGTIFSRRMLEDEQKRQFFAAQGVKGGNPKIKNGPVKPSESQWLTPPLTPAETPPVNAEPNPNPTSSSPSSSSSSPSSNKDIDTPTEPEQPEIDPQRIVDLWNEVCGHVLAKVRELTKARRGHIKARLGKRERRDEVWWREYFTKIINTPFLCGQSKDGWKATFDFATESEDKMTKVLEGQYDRSKAQASFNAAKEKTSTVLLKRDTPQYDLSHINNPFGDEKTP